MKNVGCVGCHQLGQEVDAHDPGGLRPIQDRAKKPGCGASQSGQAGEHDDQPHRRPVRRRAVQVFRRLDRPHRQGRTAERQAAAAARRRAQHRRHVVGMVDAGQISARSDLVGPAQSDRQCLRPALRLAGILDRQHADPRSEDEQGLVLQDAGPRPGHAGIARAGHAGAVKPLPPSALLGRREALGHARQQSQFDVRRARAGSGSRRPCAAWTIRPSARRARTIPTPRRSRSTRARARSRCSIRRR